MLSSDYDLAKEIHGNKILRGELSLEEAARKIYAERVEMEEKHWRATQQQGEFYV
jgi:hypothetical protein